MRILVKMPTRERPEKALKVLSEYVRLASDNTRIHYMVNIDNNDASMRSPYVLGRLMALGVTVYYGDSLSKIHACNRDMHKAPEHDIIVLASDDMECRMQGWDEILRAEMQEHFPDTDGVLWHWDGDPQTRHNLNTMCILGRKYFQRFGYIYNPKYTSLWCDNEFTEVANQLGKQYYSETVLFKHVHYSNTRGLQPDNLMRRTQSFFEADKKIFLQRRANHFS